MLLSAAISRAVRRLSRRRAKEPDICCVKRKASAPERMAIGQPVNNASAAPKVALANRQVSVIRNRIMAYSG